MLAGYFSFLHFCLIHYIFERLLRKQKIILITSKIIKFIFLYPLKIVVIFYHLHFIILYCLSLSIKLFHQECFYMMRPMYMRNVVGRNLVDEWASRGFSLTGPIIIIYCGYPFITSAWFHFSSLLRVYFLYN